ncbi:uncharacterized protein LOC108917591 [Anoplophora glabripennis]|uniref:uncharacterized protein LOC108917591 n=1 Tax=Anoplophora glabripennis TaxID=217634 RepID=UPI000873AD65|nr:uncharacterized protein LOC108917591 [Anoplophora glabripennis]
MTKQKIPHCQFDVKPHISPFAMLSQTKMQLWYPKKSSEEPSTLNSNPFMNKYKQDEKCQIINNEDCDNHSLALSDTSDGNEEINVEFLSEDDSSRVATPGVSDCEDEVERKRRKADDIEVSDFIDLDYWKKETLCCGTIFRGMYDEILVDARFIKPCKNSFLNRERKRENNI